MPDFSATVLDIVKVRMNEVFNTNATVNPELSNNPNTAPMVMMKQTAVVEELRQGSGNTCVGTRVGYLIADNTAKPTGSATPIASSCDLTTGDTVSTNSKDFDFNYFLKENIEVNDEDCDNFIKFADRVAFNLTHKMSLMVQSINDQWINTLEANKSVVTATNLPDDVTVVAGNYTITGAQFWKTEEAADTIAILDQLARVKGLPNNYYIVSGKAMRVAKDNAQQRQVNDNQRSFYTTFQRKDISFDEDNLDLLIGAEVIYLVDPNVTVSYFYSEYPETPEATNDKNNTQNFSLPLQWYDQYQDGNFNLSTLQFMNGGAMQDVRVDIRYQKTCNPTLTKYGKVSHDHVWELDVMGIIDLIPVEGDNTGIIRVDKAL